MDETPQIVGVNIDWDEVDLGKPWILPGPPAGSNTEPRDVSGWTQAGATTDGADLAALFGR